MSLDDPFAPLRRHDSYGLLGFDRTISSAERRSLHSTHFMSGDSGNSDAHREVHPMHRLRRLHCTESGGIEFTPHDLVVVRALRAPLAVAGGCLSVLCVTCSGAARPAAHALGVLAPKLEVAPIVVDDPLALRRPDPGFEPSLSRFETVDLVEAAHIRDSSS